MDNELIAAFLALAGTLAGSFSGILVSNRLVNYRIGQLEKKVEKHNELIERVTLLESEKKALWRRQDELKEEIGIIREVLK